MVANSVAVTPYHPVWIHLPTLVWAGLLLLAVLIFHRRINALLQVFEHRVRRGGGFKVGSLEIERGYVTPDTGTVSNGAVTTRRDEKRHRFTQRKEYYKPNRMIMLVHRITPSIKKNQLYDLLIYCVPHPKPDVTLNGVKQVDYYFGTHWGDMIFTSIDRARGFPVSTSAFGPFVCTAEIHFVDGQKAMVSRYIDFEMGAVGPAPLPEVKHAPR